MFEPMVRMKAEDYHTDLIKVGELIGQRDRLREENAYLREQIKELRTIVNITLLTQNEEKRMITVTCDKCKTVSHDPQQFYQITMRTTHWWFCEKCVRGVLQFLNCYQDGLAPIPLSEDTKSDVG
jgi:hypothetical protein